MYDNYLISKKIYKYRKKSSLVQPQQGTSSSSSRLADGGGPTHFLKIGGKAHFTYIHTSAAYLYFPFPYDKMCSMSSKDWIHKIFKINVKHYEDNYNKGHVQQHKPVRVRPLGLVHAKTTNRCAAMSPIFFKKITVTPQYISTSRVKGFFFSSIILAVKKSQS